MKLEPKHQIAATLMAQGRSNVSIAEELNVAHETVSRWRNAPEIKPLVNRGVNEVSSRLHARFVALQELALDKAEEILSTGETKDQIPIIKSFISPGAVHRVTGMEWARGESVTARSATVTGEESFFGAGVTVITDALDALREIAEDAGWEDFESMHKGLWDRVEKFEVGTEEYRRAMQAVRFLEVALDSLREAASVSEEAMADIGHNMKMAPPLNAPDPMGELAMERRERLRKIEEDEERRERARFRAERKHDSDREAQRLQTVMEAANEAGDRAAYQAAEEEDIALYRKYLREEQEAAGVEVDVFPVEDSPDSLTKLDET